MFSTSHHHIHFATSPTISQARYLSFTMHPHEGSHLPATTSTLPSSVPASDSHPGDTPLRTADMASFSHQPPQTIQSFLPQSCYACRFSYHHSNPSKRIRCPRDDGYSCVLYNVFGHASSSTDLKLAAWQPNEHTFRCTPPYGFPSLYTVRFLYLAYSISPIDLSSQMLSSCSLLFLQVTVETIQNGRNLKVVGDLNLFVCSISGPDALCVINT